MGPCNNFVAMTRNQEYKVCGNKKKLSVNMLLYYNLDKLDILFFTPRMTHFCNTLFITAHKQRSSCGITDIVHSIDR